MIAVERIDRAPLANPKLVTDVSDRALFAYSEVVLQSQDMCSAPIGD